MVPGTKEKLKELADVIVDVIRTTTKLLSAGRAIYSLTNMFDYLFTPVPPTPALSVLSNCRIVAIH